MTDFPPPKYVDDVSCHERWTELVQVLFGPPGTIRIEFCVARYTAEPPVHADRVSPVARIAMTVGQAQFLRDQITERLANLQQQAALAQAPPTSEMKN
jgi:hypothetical protein